MNSLIYEIIGALFQILIFALIPFLTTNELYNQEVAKLQPFLDRLNKLGTYTTKYSDWVVL